MKVDVRQLAQEGLAQGQFPANQRADFRVHVKPDVLRGIEAHAKADHSVEICGVLVGDWKQDELGPYAAISDYIRCDNAASKFAEVTFTHESWAQINKEMDSRFADKRIIGWYHSHPDFGIFLSDRDCFIQENFFSSPGQVAYVIDPVRDLEGMFAWRDGKPTPLPFFWAGDELRATRVAEGKPREGAAAARGMSADPGVGSPAPERAAAPLSLTILGWMCLFLLGYLYAGLVSRSQRQQEIEAAISRFANTRVLKLGLGKDLDTLRTHLATLTAEYANLPEPGAELTKKEREAAVKRQQMIGDNLAVCTDAIASIKAQYTLSRDELAAIERLIAEQQAVLRATPAPAAGGARRPTGAGAAGAAGEEARPAVDEEEDAADEDDEEAESSPEASPAADATPADESPSDD